MSQTLTLCIAGLDHHRAGRLPEAERLYRDALATAPDDPLAYHYLALLLLATGRPAEAANCWRRMLVIQPGHVPALVNLGNAELACGRPEAAIAVCEWALALAPGQVEARVTLGSALLGAGRVAEAVAAYRAAVDLRPNFAPSHAGLAIALLRDGAPAPALASADAALALDDRLTEAMFARGTALSSLRRPLEAVAALRQAIERAPGHAHAHLNLGNALLELDDRAAAEIAIRTAIARDPTLPEAHGSLGYLLAGDGRLAEAIAACREAIRLRPDFAQAHWNLSFAHMLAGDYGPGWEEYEWRKRHPVYGRDFRRLPGPEWTGDDLAGKRILVLAEQGLGDTIQFSRYLPLLAARGARVILACARPLRALLGQLAETVDRDAALPDYDVWVDQMSLPRLFGTRVDSIPSANAYLRPSTGASPAGTGDRLRVGLVWAGNPNHSNDRRRSIGVVELAPILAVPGCDFLSLQVGPTGKAIETAFAIPDQTATLPDFAATADMIATLDLVIAVDTAVAHLAGALGCPVWVLLPAAPDWRWMFGRADSPWYASMTLFRQSECGDWFTPVSAVAAALARRQTLRVINAPATAATAVTTVPQAMSIRDTATDQPFSVDRLVMS